MILEIAKIIGYGALVLFVSIGFTVWLLAAMDLRKSKILKPAARRGALVILWGIAALAPMALLFVAIN